MARLEGMLSPLKSLLDEHHSVLVRLILFSSELLLTIALLASADVVIIIFDTT